MISLVITTYNRTELLFESFAQVLNDDRISEIVIVDDCSDQAGVYAKLITKTVHHEKIKLHRNPKNLGCYHNKREAISKASNAWVIIWDSDNVMTMEYVDTLYAHSNPAPMNAWYKDMIYQPTFARPNFNFGAYSGLVVNNSNVGSHVSDSTFTTALNAMNYFVNRDEYLRVWEDRPEPWTADSLLQNYNWLKAGNSIYFCPGLEYEHRVHEGSHYKEHHKKTGNLYNELVNKLKAMR